MKKLIGALALGTLIGNAQAIPVDLGLSLVIDVSSSVSNSEYDLQMDGYANAFRSAGVQDNILTGDNGGIGVNVVFFASSFFSTSLDSFSILDSTDDINLFADTLDSFVRPGSGGTDIFDGTNQALDLIDGITDLETDNWVIDVSGDGTDSASANQDARDRAAAAGVVINGLAIESSATSTTITDFYGDNVITSDGFVETAAGFEDFQRAVEKKLQIETGGGQVPVPGTLALLALGLIGVSVIRKKPNQ